MKLNKWHGTLAVVIFLAVSANELGFGLIAFVPSALIVYWLMTKAFAR